MDKQAYIEGFAGTLIKRGFNPVAAFRTVVKILRNPGGALVNHGFTPQGTGWNVLRKLTDLGDKSLGLQSRAVDTLIDHLPKTPRGDKLFARLTKWHAGGDGSSWAGRRDHPMGVIRSRSINHGLGVLGAGGAAAGGIGYGLTRG